MADLTAAGFFDLDSYAHRALFADNEPVWTALGPRLDAYLAAWTEWTDPAALPAGVHVIAGPVAVAPGCRVEPGAVLRGPLILGAGTEVRTGAYLRGGVVAGAGCVIGAHSEVKRAVLLDRAHAPHQNYVGDSILGADVNLGAGTILSNVKNVGDEVTFPCDGRTEHTGLRKFGAVLGDGCRTGCNTVTNPGVLMARGCVTYPGACLRSGYYPARTLVKVRQAQQQMALERLRS
jgi:NDP-sugar pyrophosphorylase family protein